jgi:hypothetical protein
MKLLLLIAIIGIAVAMLSDCEARYRDVSGSAGVLEVGSTCEVTSSLRAHGVTRKLERDKKTDYISIWNPGFTGPEMTFLVNLNPGVKLHVLAARECTNCPFDRLLEYQVRVSPEPPQFGGKPAYVRAESMSPPSAHCPRKNAA